MHVTYNDVYRLGNKQLHCKLKIHTYLLNLYTVTFNSFRTVLTFIDIYYVLSYC